MVDARTRKTIEHGRRIRAVLSQAQYQPQPLAVQIALLLALSEGLLDQLAPERLAALKMSLPDWLAERAAAAVHRTERRASWTRATQGALLDARSGPERALSGATGAAAESAGTAR